MTDDQIQMARIAIKLLAPLLTLIGVSVSAWGTFKQTSEYHPFTALDFVRTAFRSFWLVISFRHKKAEGQATISSSLNKVNAANKPMSLLGIYMIFVGFALQAGGTLLWLTDALIDMAKPVKH